MAIQSRGFRLSQFPNANVDFRLNIQRGRPGASIAAGLTQLGNQKRERRQLALEKERTDKISAAGLSSFKGDDSLLEQLSPTDQALALDIAQKMEDRQFQREQALFNRDLAKDRAAAAKVEARRKERAAKIEELVPQIKLSKEGEALPTRATMLEDRGVVAAARGKAEQAARERLTEARKFQLALDEEARRREELDLSNLKAKAERQRASLTPRIRTDETGRVTMVPFDAAATEPGVAEQSIQQARENALDRLEQQARTREAEQRIARVTPDMVEEMEASIMSGSKTADDYADTNMAGRARLVERYKDPLERFEKVEGQQFLLDKATGDRLDIKADETGTLFERAMDNAGFTDQQKADAYKTFIEQELAPPAARSSTPRRVTVAGRNIEMPPNEAAIYHNLAPRLETRKNVRVNKNPLWPGTSKIKQDDAELATHSAIVSLGSTLSQKYIDAIGPDEFIRMAVLGDPDELSRLASELNPTAFQKLLETYDGSQEMRNYLLEKDGWTEERIDAIFPPK